MRYDCGGYSLEIPRGWFDTTDDRGPFTLSRDGGVGALQFSVGLYCAGVVPSPDASELGYLLEEFTQMHSLGMPREGISENGSLLLAAASFLPDERTYVRVWYVSRGGSFAQITYVCEKTDLDDELSEAEAIVRSIQFASK